MQPDDTRGRQREATRARIAAEACRLFGENGFERTSVRRVAEAAGVDPALVLHYYGSKEQLFRLVATPRAEDGELRGDAPLDAAVAALADKLDGTDPAFRVRLRSMLTHPAATAAAREEFARRAAGLASMVAGDDGDLRAALALAMNLGVAVARDLLEVEPLVRADREAVVAEMRRALRPLLEPEA